MVKWGMVDACPLSKVLTGRYDDIPLGRRFDWPWCGRAEKGSFLAGFHRPAEGALGNGLPGGHCPLV